MPPITTLIAKCQAFAILRNKYSSPYYIAIMHTLDVKGTTAYITTCILKYTTSICHSETEEISLKTINIP